MLKYSAPSEYFSTLLGPGANADRLSTGRQLTLLGVRDVSGKSILGPAPSGQCTLGPIDLNPGRYTLEVARCTSSCSGSRFNIELDAARGHDGQGRRALPLRLVARGARGGEGTRSLFNS